MLRVLWKRRAISHAQEMLRAFFEDASDGGRQLELVEGPHSAHWIAAWDLWVCFVDEPDRTRNLFGLGDPPQTGTVRPIVELNLPRSGVHRNLGGAVAGDDEHGLHLMHRGLVHGGKARLLRWFSAETIPVWDRTRMSELILVAVFDQPAFAGQIASFVRRVAACKAGEEPPRRRAWISDARTREAVEYAWKRHSGDRGYAAATEDDIAHAIGEAALHGGVALLPLPVAGCPVATRVYHWEAGSVRFEGS